MTHSPGKSGSNPSHRRVLAAAIALISLSVVGGHRISSSRASLEAFVPTRFQLPARGLDFRASTSSPLRTPHSLFRTSTRPLLMARDNSDYIRDQPTTFVQTPGGMVEVGSFNAKRDFMIDEHMLAAIPEHADPNSKLGSVSLVGAGPGDPDLLTVAAVKELQSADLVVCDRLVSAEIMSMVKCELKVAQKHPGCAQQAQREIYRWCFEALMLGKKVVRLKIGDPFVFGRGGEEVVAFRRFGIEPKVIPGISSALAGPAAAMIPVTHRGIANKVVFCTGMDRNENVPDVPVYSKEQTVVYLMAIGRLSELCTMMIDKGYPKDTPVGICERATTPQQRDVYGTLETIGGIASEKRIRAPAVVVVGEVVGALGKELDSIGAGAVQGRGVVSGGWLETLLDASV